MPSMLEVMRSRQGIQEIPGKGHNPVIVGWAEAIGHKEVIDDETSWCSICMSSAALEADMPMPPINVRMMARSWLTWGVAVTDPREIQKGDVIIWPRGNPAGPFGHVNIVADFRMTPKKVKVKCLGGNQGGLKGGDAVTETDWLDLSGAIGIRRGVPSTVKGLRNAGSSTIRSNDRLEKTGIVAVFFGPIIKGIESLFNGAPGISSTDGLSYWQIAGRMGNDVFGFITGQPWWLAIPIVGAGAWAISYLGKRSRVAEHASGVPIAAEVAKLGA